MVIGTGLIAKKFSNFIKNKEVLIFASGVSNSTESDAKQFLREFDLLKKTIASNPKVQLVYFSTLSIEDPLVKKRPYIHHKLALEKYIKENCNHFLICRVSNVVGQNGNSNTIINYLVRNIKSQEKIEIWKDAERNIIDIDDVKYIIEELLNRNVSNKVVTVAMSKNISVVDIVSQIELHLHIKANASYINKGEKLIINTSEIVNELKMVVQKKGDGIKYIASLLNKYY